MSGDNRLSWFAFGFISGSVIYWAFIKLMLYVILEYYL